MITSVLVLFRHFDSTGTGIKAERRACSRPAVDADESSMLFDDLFGDGKSKAGPFQSNDVKKFYPFLTRLTRSPRGAKILS